jgi:hypothetical protein
MPIAEVPGTMAQALKMTAAPIATTEPDKQRNDPTRRITEYTLLTHFTRSFFNPMDLAKQQGPDGNWNNDIASRYTDFPNTSHLTFYQISRI